MPGFDGRPAIAVLAFENLSGDPEQEYFADGISEDILTRLAMWRWLPVIARNSSFVYKGGAVDVKQVGRDLGARYVVEGSVRKAGNRVRITGQLIDAETGHHVWAEKYDRDLDDIFAVQDEITDAIVAALEPAVGRAEMDRAQRMNPAHIGAWDLYQRGFWRFNQFTKDDFAAAYDLMGQAIELEPRFAAAFAAMGFIRAIEAIWAWTDDPGAAIKEVHEKGRAAFELDPMDPSANACLGAANTLMRQYEAGETALRRAIELNPSYAFGYYCLSAHALLAGPPEPGIEAIERAIRISPNDVMLAAWFGGLSALHYMARDYERALAAADRSGQRNPSWPGAHRGRAAALAQLGRMDEAKEALADFLKLAPGYTMTTARLAMPFRDEADYAHYMAGLRLAGLPD